MFKTAVSHPPSSLIRDCSVLIRQFDSFKCQTSRGGSTQEPGCWSLCCTKGASAPPLGPVPQSLAGGWNQIATRLMESSPLSSGTSQLSSRAPGGPKRWALLSHPTRLGPKGDNSLQVFLKEKASVSDQPRTVELERSFRPAHSGQAVSVCRLGVTGGAARLLLQLPLLYSIPAPELANFQVGHTQKIGPSVRH